MHDVTYSQESINREEGIIVEMPPDETEYPLNTTFWIPRTASDPSTGLSKDNPRQLLNYATTWLDLSALYGSTREVALKLRSFEGGKLLAQKSTYIDHLGEYLPYNTMGVPISTKPGVNPENLFAGGDPRTNEDWILLAVHTLLLREHNRLCGILAKKHPEYDDEQLYQTVRLLMSAKYMLV
jgi:peroxidase